MPYPSEDGYCRRCDEPSDEELCEDCRRRQEDEEYEEALCALCKRVEGTVQTGIGAICTWCADVEEEDFAEATRNKLEYTRPVSCHWCGLPFSTDDEKSPESGWCCAGCRQESTDTIDCAACGVIECPDLGDRDPEDVVCAKCSG